MALLLYSTCFLFSRKHLSTLRPSYSLPAIYLQSHQLICTGRLPCKKPEAPSPVLRTSADWETNQTHAMPSYLHTCGVGHVRYGVATSGGPAERLPFRPRLIILPLPHPSSRRSTQTPCLCLTDKNITEPKPSRTCHLVLQASGRGDQVCICVDY